MTPNELHQAECNIGQRLRQTRLKRSLTQEELAALAGTKQAVIQKIENGHSKRPRVLADLAIALEVNPAWLQWGEPYAQKHLDRELFLRVPCAVTRQDSVDFIGGQSYIAVRDM